MGIPKHLRLAAATAVIAVSGAFYSGPAMAGDFHCWRGCDVEISPEPIKKTIIRRIEIEPGVYDLEYTPAQYGWIKKKVLVSGHYKGEVKYKVVKKRVLLKQYQNIAIYDRGKYRLVREKVEIYPETSGWSYFSTKD